MEVGRGGSGQDSGTLTANDPRVKNIPTGNCQLITFRVSFTRSAAWPLESLLMHIQVTTFLVPRSQWGLGQASADRNGHLLMLLEHPEGWSQTPPPRSVRGPGVDLASGAPNTAGRSEVSDAGGTGGWFEKP